MERPPRAQERERGATAVESAIILPLLLLIVFGIIEWGLVFRNVLTEASATRSGARTASTMARQPNYPVNTADAVASTLRNSVTGEEIKYLSIYKADPADGEPVNGSFETCTTCYRYTWDAGTEAWTPVGGASWPAATQSACGGTSDTDYIGVYVRIEHQFLTGFFGNTITLTDSTVMRLEPIASSEACKP